MRLDLADSQPGVAGDAGRLGVSVCHWHLAPGLVDMITAAG